ncbi:OprO/OprP family phosphate-selective porin [bacterium]|nr:OprO/OprP family phosphate-selective porin [bacterium]
MTAAIVAPTVADENEIKVIWKDTLRLESADGNNKLKFGGRIHWQNAFFSDDEFGGKLLEDGDEFRRSRIYVSGLIRERYDFKMQYDFAGGDADFKDIYFGIKDIPVLGNLRVGQFKEPLSLEELNSSNSNSTIERANVNLLVPSRSAGIMAYDNFVDSRVSVAAGLFRGADDSYGNYKGDGYASTARLSGLPYLSEDASRLMHLAIGYSYRGDDTATYLLQQSCDLRISQLRMLIGFPAQSSLQLCLPGIRLFRPIRVGATIQPKMPAGRSCRTSIPGDNLLCHLSLVSAAYNFFSCTSFNSSLPSISQASIRLSRVFSRWSSLSCLA